MKKEIQRFEDIIGWQKGRALVKTVYEATYEEQFKRDFALRDQIRRASISISSNIAEGFDRGSLRAFHHFLSISQGSCAEVRTQLYLALDLGYIDDSKFTTLFRDAEEVGRVIGGLRASVERRLAETEHSALSTRH